MQGARISLTRPSDDDVLKFIVEQKKLDFTYPAAGATRGTPPAGYVVDRVSVKLSEGGAAFAAGRAALERWEQFRLGWIEAAKPLAAIRSGEVAAVVARVGGVWWLNAARIVYVVDEGGTNIASLSKEPIPPLAPRRHGPSSTFEGGGLIARFGFAYGTLPGHAESGEERFLVEWDRATNEVCYSILAFSRPRHLLARVGYPLVRRMQKRFGRDSAAAMVRAVEKDLTQRR